MDITDECKCKKRHEYKLRSSRKDCEHNCTEKGKKIESYNSQYFSSDDDVEENLINILRNCTKFSSDEYPTQKYPT